MLQSLIAGVRTVQVKNGPPTVRTLRLATIKMLTQRLFVQLSFSLDVFALGAALKLISFFGPNERKRKNKKDNYPCSLVLMSKYMAAILMVLLPFALTSSQSMA